MNTWLSGAAALAVTVLLIRAWFRWFSSRPLSPVDVYAVNVDTAVDHGRKRSPRRQRGDRPPARPHQGRPHPRRRPPRAP